MNSQLAVDVGACIRTCCIAHTHIIVFSGGGEVGVNQIVDILKIYIYKMD